MGWMQYYDVFKSIIWQHYRPKCADLSGKNFFMFSQSQDSIFLDFTWEYGTVPILRIWAVEFLLRYALVKTGYRTLERYVLFSFVSSRRTIVIVLRWYGAHRQKSPISAIKIIYMRTVPYVKLWTLQMP